MNQSDPFVPPYWPPLQVTLINMYPTKPYSPRTSHLFECVRRFALYLGVISWFMLPISIPRSSVADQPNIVVIMSDDMGFSDIGCYGSEIQTPHLDRLARNGLRYSQFYNTSRCCPTRAALLTGLYSHQAGIGLMTGDRGFDAYRGDLNQNCQTFAEVLRTAGYKNYMSGKWHVTKFTGPNASNHNWPLQRGFDRFYGTITGAGSFWDPATLCRGNRFITPENDPGYSSKDFYYTDAISDNAVTFIRDHYNPKEQDDSSSRNSADRSPLMMYVSYTSAHWPMHAFKSDITKYQGTYDLGFTPIREARYRKAIEEGLISQKWAKSPGAVDWTTTPNKSWDIRNMEVYAAMVDRMDQGIGKIIDELEAQSALDNTIVIYLQDNGGCAEGYGRSPNADRIQGKSFPSLGRNGLQTKIWPPMQTRDGRPLKTGPPILAGAEDTFVAYGPGWANVSNTPFRGYKHDGLEGGISSPLIIHWPAGLSKTVRNGICHNPCHLIDLMPTFVAAANAKYPTVVNGKPIQPMEGISLLPSFQGTTLQREMPLGFEHHGNLALRDGRWKIVSSYRRDQPTRWELYDMEVDRTELNDLSERMPDKLQAMVRQWQSWADRVGVKKWPFSNKKK